MRFYPLDVSVVIAALNERGNIGIVVSGIKEVLERLKLRYEVIVVHGGSADGTKEEAENAGAKTILQRRIGYGGALREGFMAAQGEFVLTMDADRSHPPAVFEELWSKRTEAEIVVASRYVHGGGSGATAFRAILS